MHMPLCVTSASATLSELPFVSYDARVCVTVPGYPQWQLDCTRQHTLCIAYRAEPFVMCYLPHPQHTAIHAGKKGDAQQLLATAAKVREMAAADVLTSASNVPVLVPETEAAVEALRLLFDPTSEEKIASGLSGGFGFEAPHESALQALLQDSTLPWGSLRRALCLLRQVQEMADKDFVLEREQEKRLWNFDRGLAGRCIEETNDVQDRLELHGKAVGCAADGAIEALKGLNADLRALEYEYGRHASVLSGSSSAHTSQTAQPDGISYIMCPLVEADESPDAEGSPEDAAAVRGESLLAPVAAVSWGDRQLVVLDSAANALRSVNSATGAVSTLLGGRGAGHLDGNLNNAKLNAPLGLCPAGEGVFIIADTGNSVLRCVEMASKRVSTFAGTVGSRGSADGWDGSFHSPTSVVQLPGGELVVADTGSHTLRLVEPGGKGVLVSAEMEEMFKRDPTGRRTMERKKLQMLGKLTTIAGKEGVIGTANGRVGESLLHYPTCLVVSAKGAVVLFLQAGGGGSGGPPLLRQLIVNNTKSTGRTNDIARLAFRVSTLYSFGEEPRRGPTSFLETAHNGKELLVADCGRLQLLEFDRALETYTLTDVCCAGQQVVLSGEVYLGTSPGGAVTVMRANDRCALHRLFTPTLWKKAERKFEKLIEQSAAIDPLFIECNAALAALDKTQANLVEANALLQQATLSAQRAAYASEVTFLLTSALPPGASPQLPAGSSLALGALLCNAPTLSDCLVLLGPARLPAGQLAETRYSLCSYLRGLHWSSIAAAAEADVEVLLQLAQAQPGLVNADVVAAVLKNQSFTAPLSSTTLRLLLQCRGEVNGDLQGEPLAELAAEEAKEELFASSAATQLESATSEALPTCGTVDLGDSISMFPSHGPAAGGAVAWLARLAPAAWAERSASTSGGLQLHPLLA